MNILFLQVFVSLVLVAGSVVLFIFTIRARTLEHSDRLALAPLEEDDARAASTTSVSPTSGEEPQ